MLRTWMIGHALLGTACLSDDSHLCDASQELDFSVVGDLAGRWQAQDSLLTVDFDADHRLRDQWGVQFGCAEYHYYPLVIGDHNFSDAPGKAGGGGAIVLEDALIREGRFELHYVTYSSWKKKRDQGKYSISFELQPDGSALLRAIDDFRVDDDHDSDVYESIYTRVTEPAG
jgi:hypothetical protein